MATNDETPLHFDALARVVRQRREQMRLRQDQLEEYGGPSTGTVRNVEQAARSTRYAPRTMRALESALRFRPGTLQGVLDGTLVEGVSPELSHFVRVHQAEARGSATTGAGASSLVSGSTASIGGPPPDDYEGQVHDAAPARVQHKVQPGELVFGGADDDESTEVETRASLPGAPQTLRVASRPSAARSGNPSVRPHPPAFARRRVTLDGTVLEYRSALSAEPQRIGRLPARYLPLLAALASLEEMDLGDANVGELATGTLDDQCRRDDLTAARDALTMAIATVADTVTLERDEAGTPQATAEFDSLVRAVLGGNTSRETLSFSPVRPS